jgi:hypothetical protein
MIEAFDNFNMGAPLYEHFQDTMVETGGSQVQVDSGSQVPDGSVDGVETVPGVSVDGLETVDADAANSSASVDADTENSGDLTCEDIRGACQKCNMSGEDDVIGEDDVTGGDSSEIITGGTGVDGSDLDQSTGVDGSDMIQASSDSMSGSGDGVSTFTNYEGFQGSMNRSNRLFNLNLLLKSILFACLFYVLAHPDTYTKVVKKMFKSMSKDNALYYL